MRAGGKWAGGPETGRDAGRKAAERQPGKRAEGGENDSVGKRKERKVFVKERRKWGAMIRCKIAIQGTDRVTGQETRTCCDYKISLSPARACALYYA